MSDLDVDTSRTVVRTYIPAYQRDKWDQHADQLGMSRSEFVRTMVQAGRRGFGAQPESQSRSSESVHNDSSERDSLDERVQAELVESGPLSWDELLSAVTDDVETRLEDSLQRLQAADTVRYSGREGGYVLEESE